MKYNPRESTSVRQKNAQQRIIDKVSILEHWHQNGGYPVGFYCPKKIGEFLSWEDHGLAINVTQNGKPREIIGVYKVSAVTADKTGNKHLKDRAIELMRALAIPKKSKDKNIEINKLKAQRDQAIKEVQVLVNEYAKIGLKILQLEKSSRIKDNQIANLQEHNALLTKKLAKIKSFHVVKTKS